jgi:cation:H+ antiporter
LFAIAILVNFEISVREALALLVLFLSQVLLEFAIIRGVALPLSSYELLIAYTGVYIVLGAALFVARRGELRGLFERTTGTITAALGGGEERPQSGDD